MEGWEQELKSSLRRFLMDSISSLRCHASGISRDDERLPSVFLSAVGGERSGDGLPESIFLPLYTTLPLSRSIPQPSTSNFSYTSVSTTTVTSGKWRWNHFMSGSRNDHNSFPLENRATHAHSLSVILHDCVDEHLCVHVTFCVCTCLCDWVEHL